MFVLVVVLHLLCSNLSTSEPLPTPLPCLSYEQWTPCVSQCNSCVQKGLCRVYRAANCTAGCDCISGYFQNKENVCVPKEKCDNVSTSEPLPTPLPCLSYEQWTPCVSQCNSCVQKGICREYRAANCTAGCDCISGYFRNKENLCVPKEKCDRRCKEDEMYYECTPSCKNTCSNYNNTRVSCRCKPPSCFCREGLVQRESDGKCVRPRQCPQARCRNPDEEFLTCGSTCPDTCENRGRPPPSSCPYTCARGCFCKRGLFRTRDNNCVPLEMCDQEPAVEDY